MRFTASSLLALGLSISPLATALPTNTTLEARNEGSYCHGRGPTFVIYTKTWGYSDETSLSTCHGGLLDNLRGRCNPGIYDWDCKPQGPDAHGAITSFRVEWPYPNHCVEDAIYLASPAKRREENVNCVG
jgi:hypothetical protein